MTVDERPGAEQERLWTRESRPVIVAALALMTFVAFESLAVITVLPVVVADLGGADLYSLAFAATITTGLIGMVVGGSWADRAGFRLPLAAGGAAFVVGIVVSSLATSMSLFVLGRLLQGVGGGIDSVVIYVVIAKVIPQGARPRMFGLLVAAWLLPSLVGPVVAGALTEAFGWRIPFVAVALGAALALSTLIVVTRAHDRRSRDDSVPVAVFGRSARAAAVASAAILLLHLGGQRPGLAGLLWLVPGVVLLALFGSRLLPDGTLRARPGIPLLVGLRGILGAAVAAADVYLPLYLQAERGFSPTSAGLVVSVGAAGWLAGTWLQGKRGQTTGDYRLLFLLSAALVTCGPSATVLYTLDAVPVAAVVAGCVLMGAGMGIAYPRLTSAVLAMSSDAAYGSNSASLQASESMASAGFLALTGMVLAGVAGPAGYRVTYALVLCIGVAAFALASRHRPPLAASGQDQARRSAP